MGVNLAWMKNPIVLLQGKEEKTFPDFLLGVMGLTLGNFVGFAYDLYRYI